MKTNKTDKGIPAAAFMASFSSGIAMAPAPKPCINCQVNAERWDSIYCSEACRRAFLTFPTEPKPPKFSVVERWDGQKWIEVRLEWDGAQYSEPKEGK